MQPDEIDLIDTKLKEERDPKVRDRLRTVLLLREGYKPKAVTTRDHENDGKNGLYLEEEV